MCLRMAEGAAKCNCAARATGDGVLPPLLELLGVLPLPVHVADIVAFGESLQPGLLTFSDCSRRPPFPPPRPSVAVR